MARERPLILVMDDETHVRSSVRAFLEDHDYRVSEAADGRQGLAVFAEEQPKLVFIDLRMPGVNGLEVLKHIAETSPDTPAIIVSGTGEIRDSIAALRSGAWDYVLKPIDDMSILLHVISKAFEKAKLIQQNRDYQKQLESAVWERTQELQEANSNLKQEIYERVLADKKVIDYQNQLRALVSQLTLSEEKERKRLATALHDSISQTIAVMKMKVDSLLADGPGMEVYDALQDIRQTLIDLIDQTQNITKNLDYPVLRTLGLSAGIEDWLTSEIEKKHHIRTSLQDEGCPKDLDSDVRAMLFRSVRELSMNVVKHARAKHLTVGLKSVGNSLQLCVKDDGVGFDPQKQTETGDSGGGYGLFSIKERVTHLGGRFEIQSASGQGTCVTLEIRIHKSTTEG